jgi:S1-C subfamily serine protease
MRSIYDRPMSADTGAPPPPPPPPPWPGAYGPGGPGGPAGYGYGGNDGPPGSPVRRLRRGVLAALVALVVGLGTFFGLQGASGTQGTAMTTSEVAAKVDPGLVDIVSSLGFQQAEAAGTGQVLTSSGEVLTNNHVIEGATSIKATDIGNGRTYTAKVVGYDASKDVAVIQLQNAHGLRTAALGDSSSVRTGDSVTALGNAGGKGGTPSVANGKVTSLNQSITASDEGSGVNAEQLTGLIETNADIQPGDSGGALVNSYGQVVGMNTAASSGAQFQSASGQAAVQAYAIPIDKAESIAKQIENGQGSSTVHIGATAFLGIESGGSSSSGSGSGDSGGFGDGSGFGGFGQGDGSGFGGFGQGDGSGSSNGGSASSGLTISGTLSGSPADNAGLGEGDTITSVAGQSVSSATDIEQILVKYHPGDKISISWVDQSGQSQTATVTLANGPAA